MTALEEKYKRIKDKLGDQVTFYVDDIQELFPEMKKSSLYWNVSKMVEIGYLKKSGMVSMHLMNGMEKNQ